MSNAQPITKESTLDLSRDEWLQVRKTGIGSSDIGAIMGLSEYKTPHQVWLDKTSNIIEFYDNNAMRRGRVLEQTVADEYARAVGMEQAFQEVPVELSKDDKLKWVEENWERFAPNIRKDNFIRRHIEYPFLLANNDRLIVGGDSVGILECKTVASYAIKNWEGGQIPMSYYAQLQHQLLVSGYRWGVIAVLEPESFVMHINPFERDEAFCANLLEIAKKFWIENVLAGVAPDKQYDDYVVSKDATDTTINATGEIAMQLIELRDLKEKIKALESSKETVEVAVKTFMGENGVLAIDGKVQATWKRSADGKTLDEKMFKAQEPATYEQFLVPKAGSRRFLLK